MAQDLRRYATAVTRRHVRALLAAVALLAVGYLVVASLTAPASFPERVESGEPIAPRADGATVVATQGLGNVGWHRTVTGDSPGELVAVGPDGNVLYYDNTYYDYFDVDPSPVGDRTVLYVAAEHLTRAECHATTECYRNHVLRTNLTTGETTELFARTVRLEQSVNWHDVDRYGPERIVVADIAEDRVFVANTTTGLIEWEWEVQTDYPLSSGGEFPADWTHVNDVEVLPDGRLMVSLRNQDQVVFLRPGSGLQESWTLGAEDDYEIQKEQHNPDYIPESEGGPAVLVGDSGNGRIVEYQRVDGEWRRTWRWADGRLQWPRDADRLPNGHTLVTDSNGGRVIEVNERGEVVWSMRVRLPYEAERLGTGPESTGGPSARRAGLDSRTPGGGGSGGFSLRALVFAVFPGQFLLAISYILPDWMGVPEGLAVGVLVWTLGLWVLAELYWSPWRVRFAWPVRVWRDTEGRNREDNGGANDDEANGDDAGGRDERDGRH